MVVGVGKLKDMVKEVCRRRNIEVSIDWGYWLANIVYAEKRSDSYVLITKDGLVLEVNSNCIKVYSLHGTTHDSTCK